MLSALASIEQQLRSHLGNCHSELSARLLPLVDEFGKSERIRALLRSILCDDKSIMSVARRSYAHSNGYDKLVLITPEFTGVVFELRLHVWWQNHCQRAPDIHDHKWDFASRVLCGAIAAEEYARDEAGEELYEYVYKREEKSSFSLCLAGKARLKLKEKSKILSGESYFLDRSIIHSTYRQSAATAATLVLQGPTDSRESRVFLPAIAQRKDHITIQPLTTGELTTKLGRLLNLI